MSRASRRLLALAGLMVVAAAAGLAGLLRSSWYREQRLSRMSEPELQSWTERRPDDALGHYFLGLARGRAGNTGEAVRQWEKALELDPGLSGVRWRLARLRVAAGQESEAERLLREGLRRDPGAARLHAELGRLEEGRAHFPLAATEWEKAASLAPRDAEAWYHLGRCRMGRSDASRALDAYRRAAELDPRSVTYQTALAGVLRLQRRYEEAERHCRRALALDAGDPDAQFALAKLLWDRDGATPQTEAQMRRALALQPKSLLLHYSMAAVYRERGRLEAAAREYEATLRLLEAHRPPASADSDTRAQWLSQMEGPHLNLAGVLQRLGRPAEAARHRAAFRRISDARSRAHRLLVRLANRPGAAEPRGDGETGRWSDGAGEERLRPRSGRRRGPGPGGEQEDVATEGRAPGSDPSVPVFRDVAGASGVRFHQGYGGKRPLTILEATGSGCAFLDYDNDGWLDLFLAGHPRCALYRNRGDGSFIDVTRAAGVGRDGFWIGCGTGDYDNDGWVDLFVTGYNTCALYRNNGRGGFDDVTAKAGIRDRAYQTSCAFSDVDRDGFLDLYICHYVRFGPDEPQYCAAGDSSLRRACGPDAYLAQVGVFYHNLGKSAGGDDRSGGERRSCRPADPRPGRSHSPAPVRFAEATQRFGMGSAHGKAWGAAFGDYDRDGWPDLYVANDEMPGDLFHNTGGGRMENVGLASGTAYSGDGALQGGMGADFGDYDNDGRPDLVVTTFWMEPNALYHSDGRGIFSEVSYATGLGQGTLQRVGFGARFLDADNDGWLDLFFLNGHVQDTHWIHPEEAMPEAMQLFLNQRNRRFREVSAEAGEPFQRRVVGRGAAFGDFDNDGRLDVAAIDMEGAALLLHNDGPARRNHWLMVRALTGTGPRDALGAQIAVTAGGQTQLREIQTSGSVLSAHDPRAHFGLGTATRVDRLSVRWPDGATETLHGLPVDRIITVRQGASRGRHGGGD